MSNLNTEFSELIAIADFHGVSIDEAVALKTASESASKKLTRNLSTAIADRLVATIENDWSATNSNYLDVLTRRMQRANRKERLADPVAKLEAPVEVVVEAPVETEKVTVEAPVEVVVEAPVETAIDRSPTQARRKRGATVATVEALAPVETEKVTVEAPVARKTRSRRAK